MNIAGGLIRIWKAVSVLYVGIAAVALLWAISENPQTTMLQWIGLAIGGIGVPLLLWWGLLALTFWIVRGFFE